MKQLSLIMLVALFTLATANAQIFTPTGTVAGTSGNGDVAIGNVTPPLVGNTNKLLVSDAISNNGILKLAGTNNLPNDKWWIGFSHGTNTSDAMDRARIGVNIIGGGAGSLFFTTGYQFGQAERMRIDYLGNVGIGVLNPTKRLHVNGTVQFDGLTSGTFTPGNRILTLSSGNEVIAVPFSGGLGTGTPNNVPKWNAAGTALTGTNIYNIGNTVGIGTSSPASSSAMEVVSTASQIVAITANASASATGGNAIAIQAVADDQSHSSTTTNKAIEAIAYSEGQENYGVNIYAYDNGPSTTTYGIRSELLVTNNPGTSSGTGSFAGYFASGGYGTGAGYFNGDVWLTGNDNFVSDRKFKKEIQPLDNALGTIMQLQSKTYLFRGKDEFPSFNFPTDKQYGFIAQELETVLPNLVNETTNPARYDKDGNKTAEAVQFKGVEYVELIPILTAGIQEQQKMIEAKDAKINELEDRIARLEANMTNNSTGIGNTGDNGTGSKAILFQNTPNPFNGSTEIRYSLPETYTHAEVILFDMNGRKIKSFALQGNEGQVTVSAQDLAAGMYLYSLVSDGQEVATKRMVVNK